LSQKLSLVLNREVGWDGRASLGSERIMVDTGLLDTLVKLASFGASGISIFAVFWIGWVLWHRAASANPEEHKTLRYFMGAGVGMCLIIAVISAATGIANARSDEKSTLELEAKNRELEAKNRDLSEKTSRLGIEIFTLRKALNSAQPQISIVAHPSAYVKANGTVCLNLSWTWYVPSDNIEYIWTAGAGDFKPSWRTKFPKAKWVAPEDVVQPIEIKVTAIDNSTGEPLGEGKPTKIGIVPGITGQPELPSRNC
jgi:hypothetical protein